MHKLLKTWHRKPLIFGVVVAAGLTVGLTASNGKALAFYSNGVGDGSASNPYHIRNCNDITLINTEEQANYVMDNDVDCSGMPFTNSVIFSDFSGSFDGQGHGISGLSINAPSTSQVGLFTQLTSSAVVKNLSVSGDVTGNTDVGIVAGKMLNGSHIENVTTAGIVTVSGSNGGGLVGSIHNTSSIAQSSSRAEVTGSGYTFGGIVGYAVDSPVVSNVYSRGDIVLDDSTANYGGGLVGFGDGLTLSTGYAAGSITGGDLVGGIAGGAVSSSISNTFSAVTFANNQEPGPIIGQQVLDTAANNYFDTTLTGL